MSAIKLIYVASPLRGDVQENIRKANEYCRQIAEAGDIPFASHIAFTQFLNDDVPAERQLGIDMGLEMLERCDMLLVCGDVVSEGMKAEIETAEALDMPIETLDQYLEIQRAWHGEASPIVGRITYFDSGEVMEYTDPDKYLNSIKEDFNSLGINGWRYETVSDDPELKRAARRIEMGEYGYSDEEMEQMEEQSGQREQPEQGMQIM